MIYSFQSFKPSLKEYVVIIFSNYQYQIYKKELISNHLIHISLTDLNSFKNITKFS